MSTLAQFETRLAARLVDAGNTVFSLTTLDEALRTALADYSAALPLTSETYIQLPGTGREIALNSLSNLISVLDVWWPFDPLTEVWPPNQVAGFRLWWDDAQPVLFLQTVAASQPKTGDNLRLWYTQPHKIQNLDGGDITSVFPLHESQLVTGAAGYAALSEALNEIGTVRVDPAEVPALQQWGNARLAEYRAWLDQLRASGPSSGPTFAKGWGIDKWDANRDQRGGARFWPL